MKPSSNAWTRRVLPPVYEKLISFKDRFFDDCSIEESRILSDLMHDLLSYQTKTYTKTNGSRTCSNGRFVSSRFTIRRILTQKDICAELFISQTHLIRLFNKHLEITPYQYLEQYRIAKAAVLLAHTPLSIADIAANVGYQSSSNFISKFKNIKS